MSAASTLIKGRLMKFVREAQGSKRQQPWSADCGCRVVADLPGRRMTWIPCKRHAAAHWEVTSLDLGVTMKP